MIIPKNSRFPNSIRHFAGLSAQSFIWAACLLFGLACSGQTFTTIDLPALSADATHGGALNYTVTSAGDLLYGNDATLYEQSAFGSSTITSFTDSPDVDPSFIAAVSPTLAVLAPVNLAARPFILLIPPR